MLYISLLFFIFLIYLVLENTKHRKNLKAVKVKILVNGSRGKSSVTRLIAAGLRAGGFRTFAKTTGTTPRIIHTNGQEEPINRRGNANILEQKRIVSKAFKENSEAVVFECMSLRPELQWIEANKLVRPDLYVITNVRSDHLDVMGPTVYDSADYMIASVPKRSILFTAEEKLLPELKLKAKGSGIRIFNAGMETVEDEELSSFNYLEHKENVALALSVLNYLGIERNEALQGMYKMTPDPGALRRYKIKDMGREIHFVNAMAANDPDSTKLIWDRLAAGYTHILVLINCRADRIDRSKQLAELCSKDLHADRYILTGGLTKVFKKRALSLGLPEEKIKDLEGKSVPEIYDEIFKTSRNGTLVFGIGNIVIFGHEIVEFFAAKEDHDS